MLNMFLLIHYGVRPVDRGGSNTPPPTTTTTTTH